MTIVYPRTAPPVFCPQRMTIRARNNVGVSTAPFSGRQQIQEHSAALWEMELTFPALPGAEGGRELVAFLSSLRGFKQKFLFGNPKKAMPRGAARLTPGGPVVFGGSQTGAVLNVSTSLGTLRAWLKAGDHLSLGDGEGAHLHRVTRDVDLISGKAAVNIWPRLREIPNDGDEVTIFQPMGIFRMQVAAPQHDVDENDFYYVDPLPIVEAIGA